MAKIYLNDLIIPKYDDLLNDILDHKHVHYSLYGGRGSTKSSFISIAIILLLTQDPQAHAVVFRKVANTLRDSVYSQISFAISMLGMDALFKKTISPMEMTYIKTGQKILFRGLDEPEKIKSIKAPFGYFGITWEEEVDQMAGRAEIRKVHQSTMRGQGGVFINFESFNPPISTANWANMDILQERKDRVCIKTSYLDVPMEWLSEQFLEEAEYLKSINEKAYRHEYLGEPVGAGGTVFENLIERKITDEELNNFDRRNYGLDWGWYPDPNAFTENYYHKASRTLYIIDEIKRNKTSNEAMAEVLKSYKNVKITADSAEPKSIQKFSELGFKMHKAHKPPGSVEYGIKWLQSLNAIIIDRHRTPEHYDEFSKCEYERNKNNDVMSSIPDKNNHFIDATRYSLETEIMENKAKLISRNVAGGRF